MTKRIKCGLKILLVLSMFGCSQPSVTASAKEEQGQEKETVQEVSAYTIMDIELPDFTYVPINYEDKGYIVAENGKFGMMDAYGNWMKKTDYESLFTTYDNKGMVQCAMPKGVGTMAGGFNFVSLFEDTNLFYANTGFGGVVVRFLTVREENGEYVPYLHDLSDYEMNAEMKKDFDMDQFFKERNGSAQYAYLVRGEYDFDYDHLYIIDTNGTVHGPYNTNEKTSINRWAFTYDDVFQGFYGISYDVVGSFVLPEGNQYRIYNNSGTASFDTLVDEYEFLTPDEVWYRVGDTIGIIDSNLNVLIETDEFENVTVPLNGIFFAKIDGKWKVVRDNSVDDKDLYKTPEYDANKTQDFIALYEMSVRDKPSMDGNKLDETIPENSTVKVYEVKAVPDNSQWARIGENKWVCIMDSTNMYLGMEYKY